MKSYQQPPLGVAKKTGRKREKSPCTPYKRKARGKKINGQGQKGRFTGAYTHYRRQADGSLKLVGTVAYRHDVEPAADFDTMLRENLGYDAQDALREAEAALAEARESAEDFESLVDLASETEAGR